MSGAEWRWAKASARISVRRLFFLVLFALGLDLAAKGLL